MFIPMVRRWAQSVDENPSRFLMPLAYASMLGGTCTLIGTSANILASSITTEHGLEPFGMFELSRLGLIFFGGLIELAQDATAGVLSR